MPLGEIVDPRDVVMAPPARRLGEVVDPSEIVPGSIRKAGIGGALKAGYHGAWARTEEEVASGLGWLGADRAADWYRKNAEEQRQWEREQGPVEGVGPSIAYAAGGAPLEIAKFAATAAGAAPLKAAARVAPIAARQLLERAIPWAAAGGALEAARPGATPMSVAGEAALGGAIPAVGRLSRPARGAIVGALGTGAGLAEGEPFPQALTQGATYGALAALPGRMKPQKGRPSEAKSAIAEGVETPAAPTRPQPPLPAGSEADLAAAQEAISAGRPLPERIGSQKVSTIKGEDDLKRVLQSMSERGGEFREARGPKTPWSETITAARAKYMDAEWAMGRKARDPINEKQLRALEEMQDAAGVDLLASLRKAASAGAGQVDKASAMEALARARLFVDAAQGGRSTAGRTLNIIQAYRERTSDEARAAVKILNRLGGEENVDKAIRLLKDLEDPHQVMAAAPGMLAATWGQKLIEAWKMGLLTGPTTHIVNMTSNKLLKSMDTMEHALAAGLGKLHRGDKVFLREAPARAIAGMRAVPKALKVAQKAWQLEQEGFSLGKVEMGHRGAIGGRLGRVIRTPGKALVAEDEFFKTLAYQAELESQAIRRVLVNKSISRAQRSRAIDALVESPDDAMKAAAEKAAHRLTFTTDLGPLGKRVQGVLAESPALQFVVPFFRTPVNIAKEAIKRTPGALATKSFWKEFKAGGATRDLALARMGAGSMLAAFTGLLAKEGIITGGGPVQPGRREAKFETWQPYSVRVGDKFVSYNRLEPVGMVVGMAADAAELSGEWADLDANERSGRLALIFAKNLASKTFIKGLSDFLLAATDPRRGAGQLSESVARSVVPGSALMGQTARWLDPVRREVTNPIEAVKSQVPGLRSTLPPGRTATGRISEFGNPPGPDIASPFYTTDVSQDPLARELGHLADTAGFSLGKPSRIVDRKRVSSAEWQMLWGDANKRAHDRLVGIVASPGWSRLPEEIRAKKIKKVYNAERQHARQMIRAMRSQRAR